MKSKKDMMNVIKRDGEWSPYTLSKVSKALQLAGTSVDKADEIANEITKYLSIGDKKLIDIEEIQSLALKYLDYYGLNDQYNEYKTYMETRNTARERGLALNNLLGPIIEHRDGARNENANINPDGPMGKMYQVGSRASKDMYLYQIPKRFSKAHTQGLIHIHDLDFFKLTTTCVQIDLEKLFRDGFNTGHGHIRPPRRIGSYASLACIAIQSNQNDQHGGQSIPALDHYLAPGVETTFRKHFKGILYDYITLMSKIKEVKFSKSVFQNLLDLEDLPVGKAAPKSSDKRFELIPKKCTFISEEELEVLIVQAHERAMSLTEEDTFQAMESLVFNLNTMHSRAGAQVPFSSVNYGTATSYAGRLVIKSLLRALQQGMGKSETPIFPIHVFKVKKGINARVGDVNYDLLQMATKVTALRLFPNYSFLDASFNLQYLKRKDGAYVWEAMRDFYKDTQGFESKAHYTTKSQQVKELVEFDQKIWEEKKTKAFNLLEFYGELGPDVGTEVAYMGCRTRVLGNVYDPTQEVVTGRGNLNFVTANLPRYAHMAKGDKAKFFSILEEHMHMIKDVMIYRMEILSELKVKHFNFLMAQGVWIDSEKLHREDSIREVLKHGTLSMGFVGLAEALILLTGKHHAESSESAELGLDIVRFMRDYCESESRKTNLNITLLATPAESCAGRMLQLDRESFGVIPKVTDRDYYTNSFHVPVHYSVNMYNKLSVEAPYHGICNAGHISYVECDGTVHQNPKAILDVVNMMGDLDIGYGSVNHPIDYDPVCGFNGIIPEGGPCPSCRRMETQRDPFHRIRRITGYLAGTLELFNPSKRAETRDRVVHQGVNAIEGWKN